MTDPGKKRIPRTTLLCVDTLNHELAARAMTFSLAQCEFDRAILLTDRDLDVPGVEVVRIPTLTGRGDYSQWMLRGLLPYVSTDYVLVIQWDGYVLHTDSWTDRFLDYDYVGARWWHDDLNVGNGGFSLRSRRLLETLAAMNPTLEPDENEDAAICRRLRPVLEERHAISFAPEVVADRFAIERVGTNPRPFGFHGLFNMATLVESDEVEWFCKRVPDSAWRSNEFFEFFVHVVEYGREAEAERILELLLERLGEPETHRAVAAGRAIVAHWSTVRRLPARMFVYDSELAR